MKKIIVCGLLFAVSSLLIAQSAEGGREEKLQQLKQRDGVKVTKVEKDIIKIEYPNGKVLIKNIANYEYPPSGIRHLVSSNFDSTIIDLTTIDTTLYYQKYSFWQEVPLGQGPNDFLLVGDVNNNNLPELYGRMKDYTSDYSDILMFEENTQGGFDSLYNYEGTSIAKTIYDINNDDNNEVHLRRFADTLYPGNSYLFFEKENDSSFATNLSFVFYYPYEQYITQENNNKFGEWDGDEFTDQAFHILGVGMFVFEYNPSFTNFDSVYFFDYTSIDQEFGGFAIDDFDYDGRTEFFAGSTHGDVLSIENTGNNSYEPTWTGMVETYNAYQLAKTNDVDGNGKKEIWVGGDAFYPEIGPMTRITLFEASGNNSYQAVGRIDLVGVFSFFAQNYQAVDVDKDGVEEMMVCIEQTVLILKFNGSANHQTYELFYYKRNDFENNDILYFGATMYDVTADGNEELLINAADDPAGIGTIKWFNYIYKPNFTVDINELDLLPEEIYLYPNYPNPFNPVTNIKCKIPAYTRVTIKAYNILGKEIRLLLEKDLPAGEHTIQWEGKDDIGNTLTGGVYFIQMVADGYQKTIKAVLLK